jgi:non-heme chloroperoxidase
MASELRLHGGDDQIVPINLSSRKSAKLIKEVVELYHPGLPHGLTATHADVVNRELLSFCRHGKPQVA